MGGLVVLFLPFIVVAMLIAFMVFIMLAGMHISLFVYVSGFLGSTRKYHWLVGWVLLHIIWIGTCYYYDYLAGYTELIMFLRYIEGSL